MDTRKPHRLAPAGLSKSTAADFETLTAKPSFPQPQVRQVVIKDATIFLGGFVVGIEPFEPRIRRGFPRFRDALAYAEELAAEHGLSIVDRTNGAK